jgi:small subunit ribosomal protein S16
VVRIRLKRMGRRHRPFYRISAMEMRNPRDGRVLEDLGFYDPISSDEEKQVVIKDEARIRFWLDKGATPSDTVRNLLCRKGIVSV